MHSELLKNRLSGLPLRVVPCLKNSISKFFLTCTKVHQHCESPGTLNFSSFSYLGHHGQPYQTIFMAIPSAWVLRRPHALPFLIIAISILTEVKPATSNSPESNVVVFALECNEHSCYQIFDFSKPGIRLQKNLMPFESHSRTTNKHIFLALYKQICHDVKDQVVNKWTTICCWS